MIRRIAALTPNDCDNDNNTDRSNYATLALDIVEPGFLLRL